MKRINQDDLRRFRDARDRQAAARDAARTTHRVWLETCRGCRPWTRVIDNPATGMPIIQALHEDTCTVFPRQQRIDGRRVDG
ncbi:hypothetical protein [Microbacterium sp.]|uniref:hypothetical protein n=1 Tax=Actinomycetes TaxID=1760 RepID=UPI0037CA44CA